MRLRLALVVVAVFMAGLGSAGAADAITRDQAGTIALGVLAPEAETGPAVVFALPSALGARAVVTELATKGQLKRPGKAVWLFWEDLEPGAFFQHASRLVLVDDRTGKVVLDRRLGYYPLVNGKAPAFLQSETGYWGETYQLYSNLAPVVVPRPVPPPTPAPRPVRVPAGVPAGSLTGDCVLLVGATPNNGRERSELVAALKAWNHLAGSVGMPAYLATDDGPVRIDDPATLAPPGFANQVDDRTIGRDFGRLTDREGCTDILVYVLGHGAPPPGWIDPKGHAVKGGPATILTGAKTSGAGKPLVKTLTPKGLAEAVDAHKAKATFKFVIESCFAERFDELILEPRVKIVVGSSSPDKTSKMNLSKNPAYAHYVPTEPNPSQPEFTHGMTEGFARTILDNTEVDSLIRQGDSLLARLLKASFEKEQPNDRGALAGETDPSVHDNLVDGARIQTCGTWRHNGPGDTDLRAVVTAVPPLPGATLRWRVAAGAVGVVSGSPGSAVLGTENAAIDIAINRYGRYEVVVTVESPLLPSGVEEQTVVIDVGPGSGPACS